MCPVCGLQPGRSLKTPPSTTQRGRQFSLLLDQVPQLISGAFMPVPGRDSWWKAPEGESWIPFRPGGSEQPR